MFLGLPDPDPLVRGMDPDPAPDPDPSLFSKVLSGLKLYHRERILETSTLSCNEEEEEITKPPKR